MRGTCVRRFERVDVKGTLTMPWLVAFVLSPRVRRRPHWQYRVVLFMDVVRPLKPPIKQLNKFVIGAISKSPYIGDAKKRHLDWEKKFQELRDRR